jgi:AraC family transcriptional regulator, transcriptional activator FtrA
MNAFPAVTYRRAFQAGLWMMAFLALPLIVGTHTVWSRLSNAVIQPFPAPVAKFPDFPVFDPRLPTAVVILGDGGTEASDFLAPYEVLAASGAYNVYAVAHERQPKALFPGQIDVLPHFSTAEFDHLIGVIPDIIVLPYIAKGRTGADHEMMTWVRQHWQPNNLLVTICGGSEIAAVAGLIDGRKATTHHQILPKVRASQPQVNWVDGQRYVDDGNLVSSAGITAGVDAILHVLDRTFNRRFATNIARSVVYPHTQYLDDPAFTAAPQSLVVPLLNAAFKPSEDLGLLLFEGASELALAALNDTFVPAFSAGLRPISPHRRFIASRHGLQIIPRWSFDDVPTFTRAFVLGNPSADDMGRLQSWTEMYGIETRSIPVHQYGYDVALDYLSTSYSRVIAHFMAAGLEYPVDRLSQSGALVQPQPFVVLVALGAFGVGLLIAARLGLQMMLRRRRTAVAMTP